MQSLTRLLAISIRWRPLVRLSVGTIVIGGEFDWGSSSAAAKNGAGPGASDASRHECHVNTGSMNGRRASERIDDELRASSPLPLHALLKRTFRYS